MAVLPETSQWEAGIYQLETTDPVVGGTPNVATGAGKSNIPQLLLANRTLYLKDKIEAAGLGVAILPGAVITDFDAVTIGGRYKANAGAAHAPLPGAAFLLDHKPGAAANEATQLAETVATARLFWRAKSGGTWTSWAELILDASSIVSPGTIFFFAGNTAPTGALKANGALLSRTTYAKLFAAIGTVHGAGDGATTFGLPDLRGEFLRGWDDGRGVDSGRLFGSAQAGAMLNHTHSGTTNVDGSHQHNAIAASGGGGATTIPAQPGAAIPNNQMIQFGGAHSHAFTTGNPNTGGGTETRPRNIALLPCIKY